MLLNKHRRLRIIITCYMRANVWNSNTYGKKKEKKKTRKEQSKKKKEKESNRGAGVLTFIKLICCNIVITYLL